MELGNRGKKYNSVRAERSTSGQKSIARDHIKGKVSRCFQLSARRIKRWLVTPINGSDKKGDILTLSRKRTESAQMSSRVSGVWLVFVGGV